MKTLIIDKMVGGFYIKENSCCIELENFAEGSGKDFDYYDFNGQIVFCGVEINNCPFCGVRIQAVPVKEI